MTNTAYDDEWYERERLHRAAEDGDLSTVTQLVNDGARLDLFNEISYAPLHCAVRAEHYKVAHFLLSKGADANIHESERIGDTPLAVAARGSYPEMAELLLKNGADPDIPGWMTMTARMRASKRKDKEGQEIYALMNRYHPCTQSSKAKR